VIAQLGYVPFSGRSAEGDRFSGAYPINLMISPSYRAAGLGAVLLKRLMADTDCVLNPGSSEAGANLCLGLGMRDLGTLPRYLAVLDHSAALPLSANGRLPAGITVVPRMSEPQGSGEPHLVRRLPSGIPSHFPLPTRACAAERNPSYLRWRYERHPGIMYEFLLAPDLQSLLVFHEEREAQSGTLVVRIVDLLAGEQMQDALLAGLLRVAQSRGAALVDFYCSLTSYDSALRRTGFFPEPEHGESRFAALFQPLDFRKRGIRTMVAGPGPLPQPAWYVSKGDSDQDRPNDRRAIPEAGQPVEPPATIP
jgi:hypothetical protein